METINFMICSLYTSYIVRIVPWEWSKLPAYNLPTTVLIQSMLSLVTCNWMCVNKNPHFKVPDLSPQFQKNSPPQMVPGGFKCWIVLVQPGALAAWGQIYKPWPSLTFQCKIQDSKPPSSWPNKRWISALLMLHAATVEPSIKHKVIPVR